MGIPTASVVGSAYSTGLGKPESHPLPCETGPERNLSMKRNYQFEKRQRELNKKKKKEEKAARKAAGLETPEDTESDGDDEGDGEATDDADGDTEGGEGKTEA